MPSYSVCSLCIHLYWLSSFPTRVGEGNPTFSGLNLGIINHVRSSRQVFSIIEALIRSEKPMTRCSIEPVKVKVKIEDRGVKDIIHNFDYEADSRQMCTGSPFCLHKQC